MNYTNILKKKSLKLSVVNRRIDLLDRHLLNHPEDYQAVICILALRSEALRRTREINQLNYLAKVELYK